MKLTSIGKAFKNENKSVKHELKETPRQEIREHRKLGKEISHQVMRRIK